MTNSKINFVLNHVSFASFYTKIYFDKTYLGNATSFCYSYNDEQYLITNYHVVFGRNPFTGELIDKKHASIPNRLLVFYNTSFGTVQFFEIDLTKTDEILNISYKDGDDTKHYDLVAIKIKNNLVIQSINTVLKRSDDMMISAPQQAFVLGYPKNINVNYFPIWKSASIASEPMFNIDERLPCFYIDTGTKEGMSGSPVILFSDKGSYRSVNGLKITSDLVYEFLGVYSGRDICENQEEARLGLVWKEEAIIETIESQYKYTFNL